MLKKTLVSALLMASFSGAGIARAADQTASYFDPAEPANARTITMDVTSFDPVDDTTPLGWVDYVRNDTIYAANGGSATVGALPMEGFVQFTTIDVNLVALLLRASSMMEQQKTCTLSISVLLMAEALTKRLSLNDADRATLEEFFPPKYNQTTPIANLKSVAARVYTALSDYYGLSLLVRDKRQEMSAVPTGCTLMP